MAISLLGLGMGLAGAGLDFFGKKSAADQAYKQQKQQVRQQNQQAAMQRNFQNLQIRRQNEYARDAYAKQVGVYNQQREFNQQAANRAYDGAQINRNRQLQSLAFSRSDLTDSLLEAVGANQAAIEGDNRSAQLAAAKSTYGRYGRQVAQMQEQTKDINVDAIRSMQDTSLQQYGADLQAYSQVAIAPYMQSELPPAFQMSMPSKPGISPLMIAGSLLGGAQTYNQFAAPQDRIGVFDIKTGKAI